MIQTIDFLPESYHQRRQRRSKRTWRRLLAGLFLSLIAAGAIGQQQLLSRLERDRNAVVRQADELAAQLESADVLRQQIRELDAKASLIACLRLRVPSTRLLTAVVGTLPRFVTLTEFRAASETVAPVALARPKTGKGKSKSEAEPSRLPAEEDLARLQEQRTQQRLFVVVGGVAPDDLALSRYLAALEGSEVFDDIQLVYTGQHTYRELPMRRFELRLRVRLPAIEDDATSADEAIARRGNAIAG